MSRRSEIKYFEIPDGAPESLIVTVERRVRFEEADPMGIVWHGHYPGYFQEGRLAIGEKYGPGYSEMIHEDFRVPVVKMHIEYHSPLAYPETFVVETSIHWSESVRMNVSYKIKASSERIVASGYTVQLLTDMEGRPLLVFPEYVDRFLKKWRNKEF